MSAMDRSLTEALIVRHEGRRNKVYLDSMGIPTIGIGWNLQDPESEDVADFFGLNLPELISGQQVLTDAQIDAVFNYQLSRTISEASQLLQGFPTFPDEVQAVVCDMIFNMGLTRFSQFHLMIAALNVRNWKQAAVQAGDSLWAKQVPNRAADDIALLENV
jgi:GH24 family phage-related lysozyme (muramidase)